MSFKVNDWIIVTSWVKQEPYQIKRIELATAPDEEDFVFIGDNCCVELKDIEKWVPKSGDWCWSEDFGLVKIIDFKNTYNIEVKCIYGIKNLNDNPTVKLEELEPFIGELPTRARIYNEN